MADSVQRRDPFWEDFKEVLWQAGLDGPAIVGSATAAIDKYKVAPPFLGLGQKSGHDKETSRRERRQPAYGMEDAMASFQACLQRLLDRLHIEFGAVVVKFVAGQATEVRLTVSIRPDEDDKFEIVWATEAQVTSRLRAHARAARAAEVIGNP